MTSTPTRTIQAHSEVNGLAAVAWEDLESRTIEVVLVGTPNGWTTISAIDSCDVGAEARAISLCDMVNEVLSAAADGWEHLMVSTHDGGAS